jgi:hypothetical protein
MAAITGENDVDAQRFRGFGKTSSLVTQLTGED